MNDINAIFDNTKNGSNLENNVAKLLKQHGWTVKENQPYLDPITDKPREIDIIAVKEYNVGENNAWGATPEILEMRLFIDCKNLPQSLGLYVRDKDIKEMTQSLMRQRVYDRIWGQFYRQHHRVTESSIGAHRYLADGKIAYKSTNNDEKVIGMQGINQVLHSMLSGIYTSYNSYNIDYPIIVVNDICQLALESEDGTRSIADKNISYGIDYIVNKRKEFFIIDIISLVTLDIFLKQLQKEFDDLKQHVFNNILNDQMIHSGERNY